MFQRKLKVFFIDASNFVSTVMVAVVLPARSESGRRTQLAVGLVFAPPVKTSDEPVHRLSLPFMTVAAPIALGAEFGTEVPLVSSKRYSARRPSDGAVDSAVAAVATRERSLRDDGCFAGVDVCVCVSLTPAPLLFRVERRRRYHAACVMLALTSQEGNRWRQLAPGGCRRCRRCLRRRSRQMHPRRARGSPRPERTLVGANK